MDAVPIASRATATNGQYAAVIFNCADVDFPFVAFHNDCPARSAHHNLALLTELRGNSILQLI
jgi:hypothetical protein